VDGGESSKRMEETKEERLGNLFDLVCRELTTRIGDGAATPTDLNVARQLLKDNNITAHPAEASPLANLANALPFPSSDEVQEATKGG
jgi:hypothetical protein